MNDKYSIDSQKIMFHPERIASLLKVGEDWSKAKKIYPIYAEISPAGICNHRCKFCALDYLGYKGGLSDISNLEKTILDMAKGGVKSIQFGGEGEPFLHPKIAELATYTNSLKIDISFTTNGTFLKKEVLEKILPLTSWIKVSIDAGTPKTHIKIHRPKYQDFDIIMGNLKDAVDIRKKISSRCSLGGQMLLLPDNKKEALILAKKLKKIGLDYLVIKPYSQHKKSLTKEYENILYKKYFYLEKELEKVNSSSFQIIFRKNSMRKFEEDRPYRFCHAVPFLWVYLMTNGDVYSCSSFLGDKRFKLGNYNKESFKKIWEGEKRRNHWKLMRNKFNINICRENCRMDETNRYLEKLKNPPDHVNFI